MKLTDIFFTLFYGTVFILVIYLIYNLVYKKPSIPQTTIIYEQPLYETPVIEVQYPWYGGYVNWPWWGYNWYGGYGGYGGGRWGHRTRPGRWGGGHGGGGRGGFVGPRGGFVGPRGGGGRR
jgi:hypothetical protein